MMVEFIESKSDIVDENLDISSSLSKLKTEVMQNQKEYKPDKDWILRLNSADIKDGELPDLSKVEWLKQIRYETLYWGKENQVTKLDLNKIPKDIQVISLDSSSFKELPDFSQFKDLNSLSFNLDKSVYKLPDVFKSNNKLKKLSVGGELKMFDQNLMPLNIQEIYLYDSKLESYSFNKLTNLKSLKVWLHNDNLEIDKLPVGIEHLSLNIFKEAPKNLSQIPGLKSLELNFYGPKNTKIDINIIPKSLQSLSLFGATLNSKDFTYFEGLKSLEAHEISFTSLEDNKLFKFNPWLVSLTLDYSNLTTIPDLSQQNDLRNLSLIFGGSLDNQENWQKIPIGIKYLSTVGQRAITKIPNISHLTNLNKLDLSYCWIPFDALGGWLWNLPDSITILELTGQSNGTAYGEYDLPTKSQLVKLQERLDIVRNEWKLKNLKEISWWTYELGINLLDKNWNVDLKNAWRLEGNNK